MKIQKLPMNNYKKHKYYINIIIRYILIINLILLH